MISQSNDLLNSSHEVVLSQTHFLQIVDVFCSEPARLIFANNSSLSEYVDTKCVHALGDIGIGSSQIRPDILCGVRTDQ